MAIWSPSKNLKTFQEGRWVSYGPDVLEKKREIETRWPELRCVFDLQDEEWTIIQTDYNGETSLALGQTFKRLDDSVVRRLERADEQSRIVEDLENAVDVHNDSLKRADERVLEDVAGDVGERLIHAFRKDGLYDHMDIYGAKPRTKLANRAIRHHEPC